VTLPQRLISPEDAEVMLILGMNQMGFTHDGKGVGFICTAHRFVKGDTKVTVTLPLINIDPSEVSNKLAEVGEALK